tara:strand:- start:551 stop:682 length:132 start_codon:yes stop_codon:yes gene_type:complete
MAWEIKPEYKDDFTRDISHFPVEALNSLKLKYPQFVNKYFIQE